MNELNQPVAVFVDDQGRLGCDTMLLA